jgi:RNA polymerase sigma factor (sigma-70 family)
MTGRKPFFRPHLAFSDDARRGVGGNSQAAPGANAPGKRPSASDQPALTREQSLQFREIILPHLDAAYNFARILSRDQTAAEDIVQQAFLRAFRAFPGYRGGAPKAWLFAIVRNCFHHWLSTRRTDGVLVDEGALSEQEQLELSNVADLDQDTPETALLRRGEIEAVRAALENLPEPFRETLVLRELEELSYKEISALTGAPIGTVMSRLARARQMLSQLLLPVQQRGAQP